MARMLATLEGAVYTRKGSRVSSWNADGGEPYVVAEKSSLVETGDSPPSEIIAVCDGNAVCDVLETG